jgi:hypothetical protein
MRRATWFTLGAAAGVSGSAYARRKWREAAERYRPVTVARTAAVRVRNRGHDLADAVREGKLAMAAKEAELRARQRAAPPAPEPEMPEPEMPELEMVVPLHVVVLDPPGPGRRARR